jgi:hypothetical protein
MKNSFFAWFFVNILIAAPLHADNLSDLDSLRYIASYGDLIEAFGADPQKGRSHYESWGIKEGRKIIFEPSRYMASHPDLIEAFKGDELKATTHYIQYGYKERRQINFSDLDALQYIASYRDLIQTFGVNVLTAIRHYVSYGYSEGRRIIFDALGYLSRHADLQQAFGSDALAAARHFINWGFKEGRQYSFTITVSTSTGGAVSKSRAYVPAGARETFLFTPASGYYLASVSGCDGVLRENTYTTGIISRACDISAEFQVLFGDISGTVGEFDTSRPAFVTLVSAEDDSVLRTVKLGSAGAFRFTDLDARKKYYVKFEQSGYAADGARISSANAGLLDVLLSFVGMQGEAAGNPGSVLVTVGQTISFDGRAIKGLTDGEFNYRWESDATVAGAEVSSYVPNPTRVEALGKLERIASTESAIRLSEEYGIALIDPASTGDAQGVFWTEEYSDRLLQVLAAMPFARRSSEEGTAQWPGVTKISLTRRELPEDLSKTTTQYVGGEFAIAVAAFENAAPSLARIDGKRGIFFSNRLFRAALRIASEDGTQREVLKAVFKDRYGLTVPTTDEEGMVIRPIYCEQSPAYRRDCEPTEWRAFSPNELLFLASIHEEYPAPLRDISSSTLNAPLKVSMRRRNGSRSPLNPSAGAIAHTRVGYDEFMDTVMINPNRQRTYSIIVHEKAHFIWHNIDAQTRLDWLKLSGWWKNPLKAGETTGVNGQCDKWKADPGAWEPPNTTAEDIRFNGQNSRSNEVIGHDDERLDEEALRNGWGFCSGGIDFVSTYAGFNPAEDFGESFGTFMTNPDKLRTVSIKKYEFLRDRIMQGTAYVSRIRSDLTFEVYNYYPDYTYPGKPRSLSVNVKGAATEDKVVTIRLELFNSSCSGSDAECPDDAVSGYIRLRSREYAPGKYVGFLGDLVRVSRGVFEAKITIPSYSIGGWYRPMELVLTDKVGNIRKLKQESDNFGFQMYVNNANEDTIVPEYINKSLTLRLLERSEPLASPSLPADARQLYFSLRVRENTDRLSKCFVNLVYEPEDPARRTPAQVVETRITRLPAGQADGATHFCEGQYVMWANRPSGVYTISSATFADGLGLGRGGLRGDAAFSYRGTDPRVERAPEAVFTSNRSDYTAPVLNVDRCEQQGLDERCIRVTASPTNPTSPNGETVVNLFYWVREEQPSAEASGLGKVIFYLRNPAGIVFDYDGGQYGVEGYAPESPRDNGQIVSASGVSFPAFTRETFVCPPTAAAPCDATTWVQYRARVVLPVGSAAGTWGVMGFYLADKMWNYRNYDFTELFRFDLSKSAGVSETSPINATPTPFQFEVQGRGSQRRAAASGIFGAIAQSEASLRRADSNTPTTILVRASAATDSLSGSVYRLSRGMSEGGITQHWYLEYLANDGVQFASKSLPDTASVMWRRPSGGETLLPTNGWTRLCSDRVWTVQDGYQLLVHVGDRNLSELRPRGLSVNAQAEVTVVTDARCAFGGGLWLEGYSQGVTGFEPTLRKGVVPATRFGFALDRLGGLVRRESQPAPFDLVGLCEAPTPEQKMFCDQTLKAVGW